MTEKRNYNYNTRNWEKKNSIYNICVMVRGEEFSKEDLELVKNDLNLKGSSISRFITSKLINYRDSMKGGN